MWYRVLDEWINLDAGGSSIVMIDTPVGVVGVDGKSFGTMMGSILRNAKPGNVVGDKPAIFNSYETIAFVITPAMRELLLTDDRTETMLDGGTSHLVVTRGNTSGIRH